MRIPTKTQMLFTLFLVIGSISLAGFQSNPPNDESDRHRSPASRVQGTTKGRDHQPPQGASSIPPNSGDNPGPQPPGGTDKPPNAGAGSIPPGGNIPFAGEESIPTWLWVFAGISGVVLVLAHSLERKVRRQTEAEQKTKLDELEKKAEVEPEKLKPVWELARFTLESYFKRNLIQVRAIFYVSITAMIAGFVVIVWGIGIAVGDPNRVKVSVVASASGVLTEFISLTFMAIYRSTLRQANEYVAVLERINSVGMAVQILDSMAKDSEQLKDQTRAEIIRLLLSKRALETSSKPHRIGKPKVSSSSNAME